MPLQKSTHYFNMNFWFPASPCKTDFLKWFINYFRLALTQRQMKESKRLEEEETAALEAAVHKVGQNLEITTVIALLLRPNIILERF